MRAILTHEDVKGYPGMKTQAPVKMADGSRFPFVPYPLLADGVARHVGDAVAFIVADSIDQAKDAAEAIPISYDARDAVIGTAAAMEPGKPLVWPERANNVAFVTHVGNEKRTAAAFAKAAKVVEIDIVNNRIVANYLETRAIVAEYEAATQQFTCTMGSQGSHIMQGHMAKF